MNEPRADATLDEIHRRGYGSLQISRRGSIEPRRSNGRQGLSSAFMLARISYIDRPPASRWTDSPESGKTVLEIRRV
jgi:hypothetical protein